MTTIGGPQIREVVSQYKAGCFYDGKFDDIPNTTGKASEPLGGVLFFNVHASSGSESIKAAVAKCGTAKVLVVTVLTSISPEECMEIFGDTPENKVLQFARKAKADGAHGVICSPKELSVLSGPEFDGFEKVTPGIQPLWMKSNDQKRVMTPGEAIKAGATYLVIGRAITDHVNPLAAIDLIAREIANVWAEEDDMG